MGGQEEPKTWQRDTCWRQGQVLDATAMGVLGLRHKTDADATCVVVISHDCDLANDNLEAEPDVEVIVGRRIMGEPNGSLSWGKSPRTLHLAIAQAGSPLTVELVATSKQKVPKVQLAQHKPDTSFMLEPQSLAVLRSWLSSRYNRTAFPDAFVDRMRSTKLDARLEKVLQPAGDLISFVYFDIDSGTMLEREKGEPYALSVVLAFVPGEDPDASAERADQVAEAVSKAALERLISKTGEPSSDIVLQSCFAISEDDLPVSKARVLMQWRLEHMSLKSDNEQPGPPLE